jgi:hypothetical protein
MTEFLEKTSSKKTSAHLLHESAPQKRSAYHESK